MIDILSRLRNSLKKRKPKNREQEKFVWQEYIETRFAKTHTLFFENLRIEYPHEWTLAFRALKKEGIKFNKETSLREKNILINYIRFQAENWVTRLSMISGRFFSFDTIEVTEDLKAYAYCYILDDEPKVVISCGLYISLLDITTHTLSEGGFLDDYFDNSAEIMNRNKFHSPSIMFADYGNEQFSNITDYIAYLEDKDGANLWSIFSKIPIAKDAIYDSDIIANLALGWIVAHEIAHFLLGHLNYLEKEGDAIVNFFEDKVNEKIDSEINLSMEMKADECATIMFHSAIFDEKKFLTLSDDNSIFEALNDEKYNNKLWQDRLIGSSAMIGILTFDAFRFRIGDLGGYPDPKARLIQLTSNIVRISDQRMINVPELYFNIVNRRMWVSSGILADSSIAYNAISDESEELIIEKMFSENKVLYGIYATAICCFLENKLNLKTGTPPSYLVDADLASESEIISNFDEFKDNYKWRLYVIGVDGLTNSEIEDKAKAEWILKMLKSDFGKNYFRNLYIYLLMDHHKCGFEELESYWIDGIIEVSSALKMSTLECRYPKVKEQSWLAKYRILKSIKNFDL